MLDSLVIAGVVTSAVHAERAIGVVVHYSVLVVPANWANKDSTYDNPTNRKSGICIVF